MTIWEMRKDCSADERKRCLRIHRAYRTQHKTWQIGGLMIPFVQIADPDRVLDQVAEQEDRLERLSGRRTDADQLHLPYWAELWDSAVGIGQLLVRRRDELAGRAAIDLGCGMGLAGTVAARIGMRVLFADLEPPALLFAQLNSLPDAAHVRTRRLNWQTDRLDERFDLILGADILYERKQWDFLEPFWRAHLAPGGTVLLGEPGRQTGGMFVDWIAGQGWTLTQHSESVATRTVPIRILELQRR
jgi:predicted nicotinamide N-methyase